jgi:hypothetical protein
MKNSTRWALFLGGIVVMILGIHYFFIPLWPTYPTIGWGYRHFGPRTFPWGSFIGLLILFGMGFVLYKFLFPSSGSQSEKEEDSCPYCGRKFEKGDQAAQESPPTVILKG